MGWVKLSDDFAEHPKVDELSDAAFRVYVAGLCYCARHLTDGVIPRARVGRLVPRYKAALADELLDVGLWIERDGGYEVHDYLDYNPPASKVKDEREAARERMRRLRSPERSGEPTGERSPSRSGARSASPSRPVPSRVPDSSSSSTRGQAGDDEDEELDVDRRPFEAARILAERALAARPEGLGPVLARSRWLTVTAADKLEQHSERIAELVAGDPELEATSLADQLEPELAPKGAPRFDPDCPECDGVTYRYDDDAEGMVPCSLCRPTAASS